MTNETEEPFVPHGLCVNHDRCLAIGHCVDALYIKSALKAGPELKEQMLRLVPALYCKHPEVEEAKKLI